MSLHSHIASLKIKHAALDSLLSDEMKRPLPDSLTLQELRRKKLALKQEIVAGETAEDNALTQELLTA